MCAVDGVVELAVTEFRNKHFGYKSDCTQDSMCSSVYITIAKDGRDIQISTSAVRSSTAVYFPSFKSSSSLDRCCALCHIPDTVIRAEVNIRGTMSGCQPTLYHAYDGTQPSVDKELTPRCPDQSTLVYVSHNNTLLLTFRRLRTSLGATVTYQAAIPYHPSGAVREASSGVLLSFLVTCFVMARVVLHVV